jgi:hypothetical protein
MVGSIYVKVDNGYELDELHNVKITSVQPNDLLQYDSLGPYWKNVAPSSVSVGTATNIAGGTIGSVPYQSGGSTTTFLSIGTAGQVLQVNAGATAPEWVSTTGTGNVVRATSPTITTPTITTSATIPLVIGGTGTTSTLTLRSTSGVGTTGADIIFQTGNNGATEGGRIINNGFKLFGPTTARTNFLIAGQSCGFQIEGTTLAGTSGRHANMSIVRSSANVNGPLFYMGKSRGANIGDNVIVVSGDQTGAMYFVGNDGINFIESSSIRTFIDGTPNTNDMPGRIVFYTTSAGSSSGTERMRIDSSGNVVVTGAGGLGYGTGSGGAVTQGTSRTNGVTLNKTNGAITLFSAAGSTAWQSFTVTNSTVAATDTVIVNQKSGTDLYMIHVTNIAAGSFRITFATTGGTTTEQPVFNFAIIKAVTS